MKMAGDDRASRPWFKEYRADIQRHFNVKKYEPLVLF